MSKLKNQLGEYNYGFNWIDSDGDLVGFNDVWAPNIKEARKRAKVDEVKPKWIRYNTIDSNGVVKESKEWYKGMLIDPKSFKKLDMEQSNCRNRIGWMMSI